MGDSVGAICGGLCVVFCNTICAPVMATVRLCGCPDDLVRCKCCDSCLNCGWDEGEEAKVTTARPHDAPDAPPPAYQPSQPMTQPSSGPVSKPAS